MAHSILTSISRMYKKASAKAHDWCGIQQNFTKVSLKLVFDESKIEE